MNQIARPPVQQALEKLKGLSNDENTRRMAFVRERALRDEISQISAAKQEGRMEGHMEGRMEGRMEGLEEMLEKLLSRRFGPLPDWGVGSIQQLSMNEIQAAIEKILDANSLEEVLKPAKQQ